MGWVRRSMSSRRIWISPRAAVMSYLAIRSNAGVHLHLHTAVVPKLDHREVLGVGDEQPDTEVLLAPCLDSWLPGPSFGLDGRRIVASSGTRAPSSPRQGTMSLAPPRPAGRFFGD